MSALKAMELLVAVLGFGACNLNSDSLECLDRSDCTDPSRPICVQSPELGCKPGAVARNTQCAPPFGCVCRVGGDPGQPLLDFRGLVVDDVCIDPGPRDAGPIRPPLACNSAHQCEGPNEFCVQIANDPCVYGEVPTETKCQPRNTPGCRCYVGLHPDLPRDAPGRVVSDPCPTSNEDGGMDAGRD